MDLTPTREDVILLGLDAYERRCRADLARAGEAMQRAFDTFNNALGSYLEAWKPHVVDVVTRAGARLGPVLAELGVPHNTPLVPDLAFSVGIFAAFENPIILITTPKPHDAAREPWAVVCGLPPDLWLRILNNEPVQYVIRFDIFIYVPVPISLVPTREIAELRDLVLDVHGDLLRAVAAFRATKEALTPTAIAAARADLETQFSVAVLSTLKVLQCPTP